MNDLFYSFEQLRRGPLLTIVERHGIDLPLLPDRTTKCPKLKELHQYILQHITLGSCFNENSHQSCVQLASLIVKSKPILTNTDLLRKISILEAVKDIFQKLSLLWVLHSQNIVHDDSSDLCSLRHSLQVHINRLHSRLAKDVVDINRNQNSQ